MKYTIVETIYIWLFPPLLAWKIFSKTYEILYTIYEAIIQAKTNKHFFSFSFEAATKDCEFGEEWKFFTLEIFSTQNHFPKPYILSLKWEIAEKSAFDWENG